MFARCLYVAASVALTLGCSVSEATKKAALTEPSVFKGLELQMLGGQVMKAQAFDGKVVLVVNVASQCGFTPQYKGLQKLHATYGARGLVVLAVPCNQFGGQEPGDPVEIRRFIEKEYGVTFPILAKQMVKGDNKGPLFERLSTTAVGSARNIRWNFEKFLINRRGQVVDRFSSLTGPDSDTLIKAIEQTLSEPVSAPN
ncbi:MAG: glutathione peroxidase [Myxococcota bacterium]|nr:glutathione peroxidase [Myxococcota bacterium]